MRLLVVLFLSFMRPECAVENSCSDGEGDIARPVRPKKGKRGASLTCPRLFKVVL